MGTYLVAQQLRLHASNAGGTGSIPGQRTKIPYALWCAALPPTATKKKVLMSFSERWSRLAVQFSSVAQSCPTLCDLINCSTPGLPVHHQLPEFTQTYVH